MKIFLIGYRCTGKTTVGKILSKIMNFSFLDIDKKVEADAGSTIKDIVNEYGWEKFRELEKIALFQTLNKEKFIISTGGGIVLDIKNRNFIKNNGIPIWLYAEKNIILQRLKSDNSTIISRPSLTDENINQETENLIKQREPLYSNISQIKIDTSVDTPKKIAQSINRRILNDR